MTSCKEKNRRDAQTLQRILDKTKGLTETQRVALQKAISLLRELDAKEDAS